MRVHIKSAKDFWSGIVFVACGLAFIFGARDLPLGSALQMGPAYFPTIVGALLAVVGLVLIGQSALVPGEAIGRIGLRGLVFVLGALALFGYVLHFAGLILSIMALVFVSAAGSYEFRLGEVTVLTLILAAMAVVIFYYGLGVPVNLWPQL